MNVVAIDPGREKCGLAVVVAGQVVEQMVVERDFYLRVLQEVLSKYRIEGIVVGNGTASKMFLAEIRAALPSYPLQTVNEHLSSQEARERYWQDHQPRGWRRFWPTSMQVPPEPFDDYVAVILAERFLKEKR